MNGSRVINELSLKYTCKALDVRNNVRKTYNFPFNKYIIFCSLLNYNFNVPRYTNLSINLTRLIEIMKCFLVCTSLKLTNLPVLFVANFVDFITVPIKSLYDYIREILSVVKNHRYETLRR